MQDLLSLDQVAEILGLHVRTVRGWVREGRLPAVRIGKQYRVAREDLATLAGRSVPAAEPVRRARHVEASSIVEIDAIGPAAANRIANTLVAAANAKPREAGPLRVESFYDEARGRLKVVILGSPQVTVYCLELVDRLLEQGEP
ncbi:MAG: helix-turn-helix domain-containing protein [Pseudomonadales bacterium]|nr:helix-turn-helix domain-containing protein [Pseudomonadales bacterium]